MLEAKSNNMITNDMKLLSTFKEESPQLQSSESSSNGGVANVTSEPYFSAVQSIALNDIKREHGGDMFELIATESPNSKKTAPKRKSRRKCKITELFNISSVDSIRYADRNHPGLAQNGQSEKTRATNKLPYKTSASTKRIGYIVVEQPYKCIICGNRYQTDDDLKVHLFLHNVDEYKTSREESSKETHGDSSLKTHQSFLSVYEDHVSGDKNILDHVKDESDDNDFHCNDNDDNELSDDGTVDLNMDLTLVDDKVSTVNDDDNQVPNPFDDGDDTDCTIDGDTPYENDHDMRRDENDQHIENDNINGNDKRNEIDNVKGNDQHNGNDNLNWNDKHAHSQSQKYERKGQTENDHDSGEHISGKSTKCESGDRQDPIKNVTATLEVNNKKRVKKPTNSHSRRLKKKKVSEKQFDGKPAKMSITCETCKPTVTVTNTLDFLTHKNTCHKDKDGEYRFTCENCDEDFTSLPKLNRHVLIHIQSVCNSCKVIFQTDEEFLSHFKENHSPDKQYACEVCEMTFSFTNGAKFIYHMKCHIRRVQDNSLFACRFCDKTFLSKKTLFVHKKNHGNMCSVCNITFLSLTELKDHKKLHSSRKCYICDTLISRGIRLVDHLKTHSQVERSCEECGKQFDSLIKLNNHMHAHVETANGVKPYICDQCTFTGRTKRSVRQHIKQIHYNPDTADIISCDQCEYQTQVRINLQRHVKVMHSVKSNVCDICGYATAQIQHLKTHLRIHTGEKPFSCNYCSYRARTRVILKQHLVTHTGDKNHACKLCDKKFSQRPSLLNHMATAHLTGTPFSCDQCPYICPTRGYLKTHMMIHTGVTPYECEYCGRRFNKSANLAMHKRKHTGEKPYLCKECGHRFTGSGNLTKHLANVHKIIKSQHPNYAKRTK